MSDSSDSDWEGVEENCESSVVPVTCLFCTDVFDSPDDLFQHCDAKHNLNFLSICKEISLDVISYIKIINYIRIHRTEASDFQNLLQNSTVWDCDTYMKPVQCDDPLLTFDIEGALEEQATTTKDDISPEIQLRKTMQELEDYKLQLAYACQRIENMEKSVKSILFSENHVNSKTLPTESDSYYFSSYDHFGIHHEMLQDKVRTMSYRDAIINNKEIFAERKVLDLGCGTGILSLFAAEAGASKVIAVDVSNIIYQATDIVRENGYENTIELFQGRIEDLTLTEEKVDVIISEWMGYFLLFEGMLDSVLYARERYLAPGGHLFPDRCNLSIAAVSDIERYDYCVTFWNDVYGYKMSSMRKETIKEANVEAVQSSNLCSDPVVIKEFDLMTCNVEDTEFISNFNLIMKQDCQVTALAGFFDCLFEKDLENKVILSTSPSSTQTHWKQTVFLLPETVKVTAGETVDCKLSCQKRRKDPRTLIIKIHFGKLSHKYYLV